MQVVTAPSYSPESNGAAEAFVTFKRDYVYLATLHDAASVLKQLAAWFEDHDEHHPHRGLSMCFLPASSDGGRSPPNSPTHATGVVRSCGGNSTAFDCVLAGRTG